jgi:hypothetical protein|tara:strand:+ start:489 stop:782 length:294 start_codon:yes stop_codon:yes gene_type:complete
MSKLSLMNDKQKYREAWNISKKYTSILMEHEKGNEFFQLAPFIHAQFISELKLKKFRLNKNYVHVWDTMINTLNKNDKENVCRGAMKLLHQTSVQRS